MTNKEVIKTKDKDGKEIELAVLRPTPAHNQKAQLVYNRALKDSLQSGAMFRQALEKEMRKQNLWDDEKQKQVDEINESIKDCEDKLSRGGIKKSAGRDAAIKLRINRLLLRELIRERNELDQNTAEGQAEQARFSALVTYCTVYNDTGKPYFNSVDDYLSQGETDAALDSANKLASMMYGIDSDYQYKLPENKFLQKYGYVDDKLRLVNKDGKLVDIAGNLVNEDGDRVDADGKVVKESPVEELPFLDDDEEEKPVS